jgi:hypothetical protein
LKYLRFKVETPEVEEAALRGCIIDGIDTAWETPFRVIQVGEVGRWHRVQSQKAISPSDWFQYQ